MSQISNDKEFKQALQKLDVTQQRTVAALFIEHVLSLSNNDRIQHAVKVAANNAASQAEISDALKSAKAATIDCATRCGAEGNWATQAGYFVARAALAALTPPTQTSSGSPAWQAALSCRMAQTSIQIDDDADESAYSENEWQYGALSDYLQSQATS